MRRQRAWLAEYGADLRAAARWWWDRPLEWWPTTLVVLAIVTAICTAISAAGDEALTTWGIYVYMATATCAVALLMSYRTWQRIRARLRAAGLPLWRAFLPWEWPPRVFIFTAWQWSLGGLLWFIAYRISPLPEPPDWVNLVVRDSVAIATTMLGYAVLHPEGRREIVQAARDALAPAGLVVDDERGRA